MEINNADISVIVPMYNAEATIEQVLESICRQTAVQYIREIIVVNDGSTDKSKQIVQEYSVKSSVPVILIDKKNGGVSSARNVGMENALGNWIAFCDSDDTWYQDKIEKQVYVINNNRIDLLGGNHTDKVLKILFKSITTLHKATIKELCIKMFPQTSTIIMRRSIYEAIGGFDEKQKYAEDGNYFMKIATQYEYYYSPEKMVCYDGGKRGFGQSGLSGNLKEMQRGSLKNIKEMYQEKYISLLFYIGMRIFYSLKYARRIAISKIF